MDRVELTSQSVILDSDQSPVFVHDGVVHWFSPTFDWSQSGDIVVSSQMDIFNTTVNWNTTGMLQYNDHRYSIGLLEHDYGQENNELLAYAVGEYGGSNWNHWWITLDSSELVAFNETIGYVRSTFICSLGERATIGIFANITDSESKPWLLTNDTLLWQCINSWNKDGVIEMISLFDLNNSTYWDGAGSMKYCDNTFKGEARLHNYPLDNDKNSNYDALDSWMYVSGEGTYSTGSLYRWSLTIDDASLVLNKQLIGNMILSTAIDITEPRRGGSVMFMTNITSSESDTMLFTNQMCVWQTKKDWLYDGAFLIVSKILYDRNNENILNWNIGSNVYYGGNHYAINMTEGSFYGNHTRLHIAGKGNYGGNSDYW